MTGHIDIRVRVSAPLDVMWEVVSATEASADSANPDNRHAQGHDVMSWDPDANRIVYRITPGPDQAGRSWPYLVERVTDTAGRTAYARRWGNPNFVYSYAFWQYTGSESESEIRCVADFEMSPESPMSDQEMEVFMGRGSLAAMEKTARAVEEEMARRIELPQPGAGQ
jgi:hypothetical protein